MSTTPSQSDTAHLTYFNGRGRAEGIRILLTAAGIKFTESTFSSKEDFDNHRKEWTFGQCPCLDIDGRRLVQSATILHYVAKTRNLNGANLDEETKVDELFEGCRDFNAPFLSFGFPMPGKTEEDKIKHIQEKFVPKYLAVFDKILSSSASSYLVGSRLSLADTALLEVLLAMEDYLPPAALDTYPAVKKYYLALKAEDWAVNYVQNVRKPKNDETYVTNVRTILGYK